MSLRIRLARGGAEKRPYYSIVVADSRSPRDGRYIEKVGAYNPMLAADHEQRITVKEERIQYWLGQGAQPSDRCARFLSQLGLVAKPEINESPKRSAPKAKAQERAKEREEKLKAQAEAEAAAAAEAAEAPAEAEAEA